MDSPFLIEVFNKSFVRLSVVRVPVSASFTVRFNAQSIAELVLSGDDPNVEFLDPATNPGARIRVTYRGEHLFSGPVSQVSGWRKGQPRTYSFVDDWFLLQNLGWVMPNAGAYSSGQLAPTSDTDDAQSYNTTAGSAGIADGSGYYNVVASTAETVVKEIVTANLVTRLGLPITVPASTGLGGDARAAGRLPQIRFDPLEEELADILDWSGLGLRIFHDGTSSTLTAQVWQPATFAQALTPESGIVVGGEWTIHAPTATRVVLGGPGEDVARAFWGVNDTSGLESALGYKVEAFRDATGAHLNWPSTLADEFKVEKYYLQRSEVASADKTEFTSYLNTEGRKALAEGAPKSGVNAELSETDSFHFAGPGGVRLGDAVTIDVDGVQFSDRIRECQLTFDDRGLSVKPQVGERRDDPDRVLAESIARLAAAQRRISSGR